MKIIATFVAAAMLLGVATFGVACKNSEGGTLTLEEYFQQIDEIQNDNDSTLATGEASLATPSTDASGEELAGLMGESLTGFAATLRSTAGKADDLKPPAEVKDEHNNVVDTLNAAADAIDSAVDSIPATVTFEQMQNPDALFSGSNIEAAFADFNTACNALQQVATDNNITVDLNCQP